MIGGCHCPKATVDIAFLEHSREFILQYIHTGVFHGNTQLIHIKLTRSIRVQVFENAVRCGKEFIVAQVCANHFNDSSLCLVPDALVATGVHGLGQLEPTRKIDAEVVSGSLVDTSFVDHLDDHIRIALDTEGVKSHFQLTQINKARSISVVLIKNLSALFRKFQLYVQTRAKLFEEGVAG